MSDVIVLATRNAGKVRELAEPLAAFGLTVLGLDAFDVPEVDETGLTFAANARLKAEAVARATGLTAVADDSGLCVTALHGTPGVRSARYWQPGDPVPGLTAAALDSMDQDTRNVRKLLAAMAGVPPDQRTAAFCCAMCAVHPPCSQHPQCSQHSQHSQHSQCSQHPMVVLETEGSWSGLLLDAPRGHGGFGYDPVFFDTESGLSAAEMDRSVKMARSHRARALTRLLERWPAFWQGRR